MKKEDKWWRRERPEAEWKIYEDFRYFLFLVWIHLNLRAPTDIQNDIALYLQYGPRRKIIEAFRGVGKSWITSAYVIWRLLRNPQLKIMVVSASKDRADQFSTFTKRLIGEMPILKHLQPGPDQRSSNIAFDVGPANADHSPSVKSVGIFGQLTGSRADEIIADDVEVPKTSETQGMREKLKERVKEFDAILKPNGRVTYLGTPQTEDSIYNSLTTRGYTARIWPAQFPLLKDVVKRYAGKLAPYISNKLTSETEGLPTDPTRFDLVDLMERQASYGKSGYSLQFMLDTTLSDMDRYPLKLSDLVITSVDSKVAPERLIWSSDPQYMLQDLTCVGMNGDRFHRPAATLGDYVPYTGSVMSIDPSGRGGDETGYAVVKQLNAYLYVPTAGGLKGGYDDETLEKLALIAKEHEVGTVVIESNFGDGMFTKLFTPVLLKHHKCKIVEERHNRQKELRIIDTLEPVMNSHRLVVDRSVIEADLKSTEDKPDEVRLSYQMFYQMSRITKERGALAHDDRLDALCMGVAFWTERMNQDAAKRMEQRKEDLLRMELTAFTQRVGLSPDALAMGMSPELAHKLARMKKKRGNSFSI